MLNKFYSMCSILHISANSVAIGTISLDLATKFFY